MKKAAGKNKICSATSHTNVPWGNPEATVVTDDKCSNLFIVSAFPLTSKTSNNVTGEAQPLFRFFPPQNLSDLKK